MPERRRSSALPLGLLAVLVYLFLYAPILVLATLSFSASRLAASWGGFTLAWYVKAAQDPAVLSSLRNSLIVGVVASIVATACGTAAALALHRHRFRGSVAVDAGILLPTVVPEIVLAASLLLLFATLGASLGFATVILAHVGFTVSYAFVVVKARIAGFDRTLEEAAMDLGAGPARTFLLVTLPAIAPAVLAGGLLAFALSIDDYVVTSFVTGVGATTLPLQIYSMVKSGISPEINAVSTVLILATGLLLVAAFLLEQGRSIRVAAIPAAIGLTVLAAPFFAVGGPGIERNRELNLFIWSNYISPETLGRFEHRYGVKVNVDLYDSNEALLAKLQAGNSAYDVICPSDYTLQVLIRQGLLRRIDHGRLPHLRGLSPSFLDRPYDPGNAHSTPYFWGTTGIAYDRTRVTAPIDSWGALWDERYRGRILMLDDPREAFMAALKLRGHSLNTTDPQLLREARDLLVQQRHLVRTYNSTNYEDVLLARDVWIAQGWSGQFAKAMEQDADIVYVIPKEGSTLFIDNLAIPATAPHPDLAHAFLDFVMEPEIAAEICRTMHYSTTSREALPLLPAPIRNNSAMFPPPTVFDRLEMIRDLGDATVLYDRLWTEIKSAQ
jgi:spermidine/putrescine transport system permease protein